MRARLDGTEGKELVSNGITFPNDLALDESNRRLFWAGEDAKKYGVIEWVSLDGSNSNVTFYRQGYHPFSLDIYEGFVYWADLEKKAVLRISSNGGEEEIMFNTSLKKPMGVKICQERTFEENPGRTFKEIYILTIVVRLGGDWAKVVTVLYSFELLNL